MKLSYKKYIVIFSIIVGSAFPFAVAHAATYLVGDVNGGIYGTATISSPITAGAQVYAYTEVWNSSPRVTTVLLNGGANGSWVNLIYSSSPQHQAVYGQGVIGTAPSTAGTYNANFTVGFYAPAPQSVSVSADGGGNLYASAYLSGPLTQTVTALVVFEYVTSPGGDWQNADRNYSEFYGQVVIPAGQTSGTVYGYDPDFLYVDVYPVIQSVTPNPAGGTTITF